MGLELFNCPICGNPRLEEREGKYHCRACGNQFREETVASMERMVKALEARDQRLLWNARVNLYRESIKRDINAEKVQHWSREIKRYLPEDFQANFYELGVSESADEWNRYMNGLDQAGKEDYIEEAVKYGIKVFKSNTSVLPLKRLMQGIKDLKKKNEYMTELEREARKLSNGIYNPKIPRDVFIAYASDDMKEVNELVEYLERGGLSCYVAEKNLRHGAGSKRDYGEEIRCGIEHCAAVVFVSTENARRLDRDALGLELPYAMELKKKRIEYLAEEYASGTAEGAKRLLKSIFAGQEYCRDKGDLLKELVDYIYVKGNGRREQKWRVQEAEESAEDKGRQADKEALAAELLQKQKEKKRTEEEDRKRVEAERLGQEERLRAEDKKIRREFVIQNGVLVKYRGGGNRRAVIPEGVTSISAMAFSCCASLMEIVISESVTSIEDNAFDGCSILTKIVVKQGNKNYCSVDGVLFSADRRVLHSYPVGKVGRAVIPEGVTSIGNWAFNGCRSLDEIVIPASVTSIGDGAFYGCSRLTEIVIPEGVTSIGDRAFYYCLDLDEIVIPASVTSIGDGAFAWCRFTEIVIPGGVKSIAKGAFLYSQVGRIFFDGTWRQWKKLSAHLWIPEGCEVLFRK